MSVGSELVAFKVDHEGVLGDPVSKDQKLVVISASIILLRPAEAPRSLELVQDSNVISVELAELLLEWVLVFVMRENPDELITAIFKMKLL